MKPYSYPRVLIGILSPRDIPVFREYTDKLKPDKLWVKYYEQYDAYIFIRDYFLQHTEYDYLCPLPDDLLVTQEDIDILVKDIHDYKCPVVSGWCNLDKQNSEFTNICVDGEMPDPRARRKSYNWLPVSSPLLQGDKPFKVIFSGFPLMMIRHDVIYNTPFRSSTGMPFNGCCFDETFCYDLRQKDIPILVDPRVRLVHLRPDGNRPHPGILVGKKKPHYYVDSWI